MGGGGGLGRGRVSGKRGACVVVSSLGFRVRVVFLGGGRCASEITGKHVGRFEGTRCEFAEDGALCVSRLGKGVAEATAH